MKRLFVFIPVILLVLFLLYSFVLKEKEAGEKTTEGTKSGHVNIVFKSADGGQTWQDISRGLPENLQADSIRGNSFFANNKGLFLRFESGLYHSTPNATAPFWTKEIFAEVQSSITANNSGMFSWGINVKKRNGTSIWSPIFKHIPQLRVRSIFETAGGAIFISTDRDLLKTADNGKTWKQVHSQGMDGNLAELNGVLVASSMRNIIRSTDNGETWSGVIKDSDVVFDVKQIPGGFAATTAGSESGTRRLKTSYDGGKTWQLSDARLQEEVWRTWDDRPNVQRFFTSIIQVGENFFCTHPDGIYRSTDKGKTWKFLLPSVEKKAFVILVSGNVIYAIPHNSKGGC